MKGNMRFCVPCLFGVEGLVAQELRDMGIRVEITDKEEIFDLSIITQSH